MWAWSFDSSQKMLCQNNRITSNLVCICHVTTYIRWPIALRHAAFFSVHRHGLGPESWAGGSQERFFFTLPHQQQQQSPPRRRRPPANGPHDKFFVGDQSQCATGSCEFFLFCWLGGGVVEGGCGGFLQSCCNRPNQVGAKTIVTQVGPKLHAHFLLVFFALYFLCSCGLILCYNCLTPNSSLSL